MRSTPNGASTSVIDFEAYAQGFDEPVELTGDEFPEQGVSDVAGAPVSSYCADAGPAIHLGGHHRAPKGVPDLAVPWTARPLQRDPAGAHVHDVIDRVTFGEEASLTMLRSIEFGPPPGPSTELPPHQLMLRLSGPGAMIVSMRWMRLALVVGALGVGGCSDDRESPEAGSADPSAAVGSDCDGSTLEVSECMQDQLADLEAELAAMNEDLLALRQPEPPSESFGAVPRLRDEWASSIEAFEAYRDATCEAVYLQAIEGSWRGVASLECQLDLTRARIALVETQVDKH